MKMKTLSFFFLLAFATVALGAVVPPERRGHGGGEWQGQGQNSPFVFQPQHFMTVHRSQQGRFSVIPKFTDRSNLFEGIENYRLGVLEIESKTFVAPNHRDADLIGFVAQGEGSVNIIRKNKNENFNIRAGDIVFVPAGATSYMTNTQNDTKLIIIKLIQTISTTPGNFRFFFGAGRESFLDAFDERVMEAAYDTSREKIERLLRGPNGPFIPLSDEQLKSLSQRGDDDDDDSIWRPFKSDKSSSSSKKKVNIFKHKSVSNRYGELFEVDNDDLKELQDIEVAFANITRGGMVGPLFNTRATKLAFVADGNGWVQMVIPQISSQSSEHSRPEEHGSSSRGGYDTVTAELKPGTLVVIPPGHPFVNLASNDDNLRIVSFDINAENNERVALAGKNNLFSNMDDAAKEVAFGVSSKLVDEVFESNDDFELFSKGPAWQQREERADQ